LPHFLGTLASGQVEDRAGIALLAALVLLLRAGVVASAAFAWRAGEPVPA
jgi:hypothetical protein